ncbi:oligosaccharide flippase family protein [Geobacter pickeringii]|uniref:oligosaccharide flippase family protein n=1 Tax=Geobacter pickeringii TaxID=345632 RepID=UPI001F01F2E2|nr:oligosaccharide flippase family protein [Geobacter pickeringii]
MNTKITFRAFAEIAGLVIGALSMIYVSRTLGPEYIGFSSTSTAALLLVSRFADGGLTALASQRLARDDEDLNSLLASTLPQRLVMSALFIACVIALIVVLPIDARLRYFIRISVFMIFFEACTPGWAFPALGRINTMSVMRISQSIISAGLIFTLIRSAGDWRYLPYLTVINSALNSCMAICCIWYFRLCSISQMFSHKIRVVKIFDLYKESFHFFKAELSTYIYTSSDRLILYYFGTPYAVGLYEAAYKIINPFYSINSVVTPSMFRDLAQSFKYSTIYGVMTKYVFAMSVFTIPLGFFMLYFSQFTVNLMYGAKFAESAPLLMILGFVITFGFTNGTIVIPFTAWNMQREFGNSVFWGNLLNTILNFALIPFIGAFGAAIATLAAKIAITVVGYCYFSKVTDYPIIKEFLYFFVASIIPLIVVYALSLAVYNNFVLAAVYGFLYLAIIYFMYKYHFKYNQRKVMV